MVVVVVFLVLVEVVVVVAVAIVAVAVVEVVAVAVAVVAVAVLIVVVAVAVAVAVMVAVTGRGGVVEDVAGGVVVEVRTNDNNIHEIRSSNREKCGEVSSSSAISVQARLASPPWAARASNFVGMGLRTYGVSWCKCT